MRTSCVARYDIASGAVALCLVLAPQGCSQKRDVEWTAKPWVEWVHITEHPVAPLYNEYRVEVLQPTTGLFPADLAVTRVSLEPLEKYPQIVEPRLSADPRNEFLRWNSAFDDQMAVSEVFPIDQRDLGGGEAEPSQIVSAFRALHARLGFIYAVNELGENETAMFGALYDTAADRVLATVHARAISLKIPDEEEEKDDPYHLWKTDSRALVRAKFSGLVHSCIRELILNDQPAQLESTKGWTPAGPTRPVEWPPRHRPRSRGK